jgi:hypothetical protein
VTCARFVAARKDNLNHLKSSPSHDESVKFAKALLDLSRANDPDPGLIHSVISRKPDFSVSQAIEELKEVKGTINNSLRSPPPDAK